MTERPGVRAAAAVVLSLALNALVGWLLVATGAFTLPKAAEVRPVVLAPLTSDQWDANRALSGAARPLRAPVPAPPVAKPPPERGGKFVQLAPHPGDGEGKKPPESTPYISDQDRAVEKQTVSRFAGNHENLAAKPQAASPGAKASGERGEADRSKQGKVGELPRRDSSPERLAVPAQPLRERVAVAPGPGGEVVPPPRPEREGMKREAERLAAPGEGEDGRRLKGTLVPDLSLGPQTVAKLAAGGPNMDGYREADEGDETSLNTRGYKYSAFLNAVRNSVNSDWSSRVVKAIRERDPDGSAFFYKDRTVVVGVTIDSRGKLTDLTVLQSSNVDFYDRVALASVQHAQPFPAPPAGMFNVEGALRFPYMFTVYADTGRTVVNWRPPTIQK